MKSGKYTYDVLLEVQPDGTHQASVLGWADCRAIAATAEEAVATLQKMLSDRIADAQIVQVEVPRPESQVIPEPANPWIKFSGVFKDDPMFDEVLNDIEQYRQELDALAAQEDEELDGAA
jgi:predicted RNase H-like HicB family nuclease